MSENIRRYLEVIKKAVSLIEEELGNPIIHQEPVAIPLKSIDTRKPYVSDILNHKMWPEAVPEHMICQVSDEDNINRANAVLQTMIDCNLSKLNFLDYGCGDGWITNQVFEFNVASSTGFDIKGSETWARFPRANFTTNLDDLIPGAYDVIFLYDVLDHAVDAEAIMSRIKDLLSDNGIVYIRCHPWTSKHGAHLHKEGINKSYVHLFLTEDEFRENGHNMPFVRRETTPLEAYRWWFREFNINLERIHQQEIHPFFKNPVFQKHMFAEQNISKEQQKSFIDTLKIDFVDYVLTK